MVHGVPCPCPMLRSGNGITQHKPVTEKWPARRAGRDHGSGSEPERLNLSYAKTIVSSLYNPFVQEGGMRISEPF